MIAGKSNCATAQKDDRIMRLAQELDRSIEEAAALGRFHALVTERVAAIEQTLIQTRHCLRAILEAPTPPPAPAREFIPLTELPAALGISAKTIWRKRREGDFPEGIKITARNIVYDKREIDQWLEKRRIS